MSRIDLTTCTAAEYSEWLQEEVAEGRRTKGELALVHVRHENKAFNPKTGEKVSAPRVQMFTERNWGLNDASGMRSYYRQMGETVEVLYQPSKEEKETAKKGGRPKKENVKEEE